MSIEVSWEDVLIPSMDISETQKQSFYRDGFVIFRGVVPKQKVLEARRLIHTHLGKLSDVATTTMPNKDVEPNPLSERLRDVLKPTLIAGSDPLIINLFEKTSVKPLVRELMGGPTQLIRNAQIATRFPSDPTREIGESGYPDDQIPFNGWIGHLDGLWNGGGPVFQRIGERMTEEEEAQWYRDPSRNGCPRQYGNGINIANFAGLVGIALSDQTIEGSGNLGLLRGAHHEIERFFRSQRAAGGPLGPEGPGWPREHIESPNGHGLRHYPDAVREAFREESVTSPDGRIWPKPTLVKLAPGDAVIVLHGVPHGVTRVIGSEPRFMVYYRVTPASRSEEYMSDGRFQRSRSEALCDIWMEWEGMREVVKQAHGT